MTRAFSLLGGAALVAVVAAAVAHAKEFFVFEPGQARAGDTVVLRTAATPSIFRLEDREAPLLPPRRVYLVRRDLPARSLLPTDPRVHFVGIFVADRFGRGLLPVTVPPLRSGEYVLASWCKSCRFGRTFVVGASELLRVELPRATAKSCPVTIPRDPEGRYGNGLLSTALNRHGYLRVLRRDGELFNKLPWLPLNGLRGELVVTGERLDAPGRMRVLGVYWGYASRGPAASGSWASAVVFPSEGCWRISGRVGDVTLTYVARVIS